MTLHVPVFRGVPLTTEASLHRHAVVGSSSLRWRLGKRMDSADFAVVETEVPVRRLDVLGLSPGFVKLDVQGHEHAALIGLRETLRRSLPVLMIEPADERVRDVLAEFGYEPLRVRRRGARAAARGRRPPDQHVLRGRRGPAGHGPGWIRTTARRIMRGRPQRKIQGFQGISFWLGAASSVVFDRCGTRMEPAAERQR